MGIYPGILMSFARPSTQIAQLERRPGALTVILNIKGLLLAYWILKSEKGLVSYYHLRTNIEPPTETLAGVNLDSRFVSP